MSKLDIRRFDRVRVNARDFCGLATVLSVRDDAVEVQWYPGHTRTFQRTEVEDRVYRPDRRSLERLEKKLEK